MSNLPSRRQVLFAGAATPLLGIAMPDSPSQAQQNDSSDPYGGIKFCFNTSTVRGQKLSITEQIDLVAASGYDAIEPWIRDVEAYRDAGGSMSDLKRRVDDAGITVESAIGFARWIVDDASERQKGLEQARADMELMKSMGGKRIAAPPVGATNELGPPLPVIAERYAELCKVGAEVGVAAELELWGFSKTLSRLGELAYVSAECGHPDACVLPDVYHIYKGGSEFAGLGMIEGSRIPAFHMNDYPGDPPRETIKDEHRVYPGDGIAPLDDIISMLHANGFRGYFSLELFNRDYWKRPADEVAKTGLEKMQAAVKSAFASTKD